jgi:hypothetical protein
MRTTATSGNVKFEGLKRKFQARRHRRGFGLLEAVVAGIFIVSLSFAVAVVSVTQQNAGIIQDTQTSLSDELLRQTEFVRSLPMVGTSGVTTLMPIPAVSGLGTSTAYTPTGNFVPLPLNGYMVNSFNAQNFTPTVTWTRTRFQPNATIPFAIDKIVVVAQITRLGIALQTSTTVFRIFENSQSSGLQ